MRLWSIEACPLLSAALATRALVAISSGSCPRASTTTSSNSQYGRLRERIADRSKGIE